MAWVVVGIDLTSFIKKPATVAVIDSNGRLNIVDIDSLPELIEFLKELKPNLISVDSPLQFPAKGDFRDCDLIMKKMGMKPLPPGWRGMRKLVETAIKLFREFHEITIECFPTGSINLSYGKDWRTKLYEIFLDVLLRENLKIIGKVLFRKDVLDALICALASKYLHLNEFHKLVVVEGKECKVFIPRL